VSVQISIDEQGNVVAASAVSGHPLLRSASEAAARKAKFAPKQIRVTGTLIYNFVLPDKE
jgi:outer membrane biosynthesis protein TonB